MHFKDTEFDFDFCGVTTPETPQLHMFLFYKSKIFTNLFTMIGRSKIIWVKKTIWTNNWKLFQPKLNNEMLNYYGKQI